jgi:hypothetical protein
MPELLWACREGAVRSVCGEWGLATLLLLKLLDREDKDGWCASWCLWCRGNDCDDTLLLDIDLPELDD